MKRIAGTKSWRRSLALAIVGVLSATPLYAGTVYTEDFSLGSASTNWSGTNLSVIGVYLTLGWPQLQGLGLAPGLYSNVRVRVADDHGHSTVSASAQLTVQRAGDASGDGAVSFYDYLILQSNFGKTGMSYAQGDFNGDGRGSFADYLLLEQNFGKSANPPAPVPAAPALVPAAMAVPAAKAAKVTSAQTDTVRSIQAQTMTLIAGNAKAVRPVRNSKLVRQVDSVLARNLLALDRLI